MKRWFIFSFLLLQSLTVRFAVCQTLPFKNYFKEDGLPHTSVTRLFQDSRGYLWFGTARGLCRFDGVDFKCYNSGGIPDSYILSLLEDSKKRIWLGSQNEGACCIDSGNIEVLTTARGLANNSVWSIIEDRDGVMWFGTENGLNRYDGRNFKTFTTVDGLGSNIIPHMALDRNGVLWIATTGGLSRYYPDNTEKPFNTITTADGLRNNVVLQLLHDSTGRTWIGTANGLNCLFQGKFTAFTTGDGLINNRIASLYEAQDGKIWVGTLEGVSVLTMDKTNITNVRNISTENGLPFNFILAILEDREGNMWFATRGGVGCLKSTRTATYSVEHGLNNNLIVTLLQDSKGVLWLGTGNGLNAVSFKNVSGQNKLISKRLTKNDGLISNSINGLMIDHSGKLWITTPEGLSILGLHDGSIRNVSNRNGLPTNTLFTSIEASNGTVWIAHKRGISFMKNGKVAAPPFQLNHSVVLMLESSKKEIWFTSEHGLYRFISAPGHLKRFTTADGLPGNVIDSIYEDGKGILWVGTEDGLCSFNGDRFTVYSSANGLPKTTCNFFLEDKEKNLWIGTADGLVCFDGSTFKRYSALNHGLVTDNWISGYTDQQGVLWMGSAHGLTRLIPPIHLNRVPPPVYISNVKVLDKKFPRSALSRLTHNQNYLSIGFAGLCFSSPESVTYAYRLEGIDKEWKKTADRSLFYPYLPPGDYRFQVKAINNDGIESLKTAELGFTILPPFWKTWWFQILVLLAVLSVILLVVTWRFKRSREKLVLKERTRQLVMSQRMELMGMLAGSAVHDLKNLLSIIIGFSDIIAETRQHEDDSYRYNENIKSTAGTAMQVVKQILAFARQQKDDVLQKTDLTALISDIVEILKVTSPGETEIRWSPPENDILYPINPTRFQQLVMNLCINAVHAMPEGGTLEITLTGRKDKRVLIEVSDTGTGIPEENVDKIFTPLFTTKEKDRGTGLGLFVVKQIVEEIHGTIHVKSRPGAGTTFEIEFPADK